MVNYRIERSAPAADKAMDAYKSEHNNVKRRLGNLGMPEPTQLEYRVKFGERVGKSTIDFDQAKANLSPVGDATYTVVGTYELTRAMVDLLNDGNRPTAGPAINMPERKFW